MSAEIVAYERYMRLSVGELEASRDVQETVRLIAKQAIPTATIDLVGSYSVGLATPTSDIDFRVSLPEYEKDPLERGPSPGRPKARKAAFQNLHKLHRSFAASDAFEGATILNATVPILRTTHVRTKIALDFQVSPSELPQHLYKALYLAEYPTLRPLYILLRSTLHIRGFGTVFNGGFGSYPILMMIVYGLKTCPPSIHPTDVGGQLLYILNFYASADLYKDGFSLDPPGVFPKLKDTLSRPSMEGYTDLVARGIANIGKINERQPYKLCLQDPADPNNDLGRRSFSIKHVQKVFEWACSRIKDYMHEMESSSEKAREILQKGLLFPLVGANYAEFEERRRQHELDGLLRLKFKETPPDQEGKVVTVNSSSAEAAAL